MKKAPGRPRRRTRVARALGLDRNPLRRASDRAEAWIRIGLLAAFLIAGPIAAVVVGGWAYHAGVATAPVQAAPARHVSATVLRPFMNLNYPDRDGQAGARWQSTDSARTSEIVAVFMTLSLVALALLATHRLALALLTRRSLAAWETAWSRVGPHWSRGRP